MFQGARASWPLAPSIEDPGSVEGARLDGPANLGSQGQPPVLRLWARFLLQEASGGIHFIGADAAFGIEGTSPNKLLQAKPIAVPTRASRSEGWRSTVMTTPAIAPGVSRSALVSCFRQSGFHAGSPSRRRLDGMIVKRRVVHLWRPTPARLSEGELHASRNQGSEPAAARARPRGLWARAGPP